MSLQYIIDGYNIIHHQSFSKENKNTICPQRSLLDYISNRRLCGKNKAIVVFDGFPPQDFKYAGGIVTFFSRRQSADEKIKKILESYSSPRSIVVVSDDNEVKFFCKSAGARVLSVDEFMNPKKQERRQPSLEAELSFTQMERINKELRKIWLE